MYKCKDCKIFSCCSDNPNKDSDVCDEFEIRNDGLTCEEGIIMDNLVESWNEFVKLDRQHPDELKEFGDAIHNLQSILALRVVRRSYPKGWPIK